MGIFARLTSKSDSKEIVFDDNRKQELDALSKRTIKILSTEIENHIWAGGWYERGSKNNNQAHISSIERILSKSKRTTSKGGMERGTTEVGFLLPTTDGRIEVQVFGLVVDELKSKSVKKLEDRVIEPIPIVCHIAHIFENSDYRLPDRYSVGIDVRRRKL